jgi:curli biogenesis system outer membrane secretion channel CsgG
MKQWTMVLAAAALAAGLCGCGDELTLGGDPAKFIKPTIAVMKFENRAQSPMGWDLGSGMRDVLVDRLVATHRYHVIERPELGHVVNELKLQSSGLTREQNRALGGRLKNCNYLITGTITDFGHVSSVAGGLQWWEKMSLWGGSNRAVIGLTVYVVDVESGQIIASESIQESVLAGDMAVKAQYRNVGFGGTVFYRTPLGRVTASVIDKAVGRVTDSIAARPWEPKVALVQGYEVVINGGMDRNVRAGWRYEVYEIGSPIVDPDTGDVIGHQAGKSLGKLQVVDVRGRYSVASIQEGSAKDLQQGQRCRRIE